MSVPIIFLRMATTLPIVSTITRKEFYIDVMPLTTVMQMLGWTNVDTAMKYNQTSTEAIRLELTRIAEKPVMKLVRD